MGTGFLRKVGDRSPPFQLCTADRERLVRAVDRADQRVAGVFYVDCGGHGLPQRHPVNCLARTGSAIMLFQCNGEGSLVFRGD
jgi:hypothetical protein